MIVYGWTKKFIGAKKVEGECAVCHSKDDLQLVGHQNIFHIFWLPVIPLKRETHVVCTACEECYQPETILGKRADSERFGVPWWAFSGLFIGVLLVLGFAFLDISTREGIDAFKEDPKVGAFFTFKSYSEGVEDVPYTFAEVLGVEEDGVVVCFSRYSYSSESMCNKAYKSSSLDSEQVYLIPSESFREMDVRHISLPKESDAGALR